MVALSRRRLSDHGSSGAISASSTGADLASTANFCSCTRGGAPLSELLECPPTRPTDSRPQLGAFVCAVQREHQQVGPLRAHLAQGAATRSYSANETPEVRVAEVLGAWPRAGFAADVEFNAAAGLPGDARHIALFHYAIDGLLLDRLTTPLMPDESLDDIVDALVDGLLPEA